LVEEEFSTPRKIAAEVLQGSVLAPIWYTLYIQMMPQRHLEFNLLWADDTCIYATEKHERRVFCKLHRGLTAVKP
jgi:hypothetical protein